MTDYWKAAIDAGMPIMRCRTHCPNDTDCKTCESEVQKIIAAAEPHLRKKWAEEVRGILKKPLSGRTGEWNAGYITGLQRAIALLEGAVE